MENKPGEFGCHCANGHQFRDSEDLKGRNPKMLSIKVPQAPKLPVPGLVTLTLQVPAKLRDALQERFPGERLNASLPFVLGSMLDPNAFLVSGQEAQEISSRVGANVRTAQAIIGVLYSLKQDVETLNQKVKTLEATKESKPVQPEHSDNGNFMFLVSFNPEMTKRLEAKAEARGQPVTETIQDVMYWIVEQPDKL